MKKNFHSLRKRPLSFPILMLCIILFLMYTVIDTAIEYGSIPPWAAALSCAVCLAAILCIMRFSFIHYEYIIVGDELVIRKYTLHRIELAGSFPLSAVRSVDRIRIFSRKAHRAKKYNLTNSLYATLFSGLAVTYIDYDTAENRRILISPPESVKKLLKLNLEGRYLVSSDK